MARPFSIRLSDRTIQVGGELDLSTAPVFESHLDGVTEGPGDVVLDASDLTFVDSSGIRVLFALARRLEGRGRLVIHNPTEQVLRVLDLVHAEALLEIRFDGADPR
jgi:anti-anti-sigma factor